MLHIAKRAQKKTFMYHVFAINNGTDVPIWFYAPRFERGIFHFRVLHSSLQIQRVCTWIQVLSDSKVCVNEFQGLQRFWRNSRLFFRSSKPACFCILVPTAQLAPWTPSIISVFCFVGTLFPSFIYLNFIGADFWPIILRTKSNSN